MDIEKLKTSMPKINSDLLRYRCNMAKGNIVKIAKQINVKYLAISIACVAFIYLLIFFYIYMASSSSIAKVESKLASEIVIVEYIKEEKKEEKSLKTTIGKAGIKEIIIDGLYENTKFGKLPIIREKDNLTSFRAYQQPFSFSKTKKPIISFIVIDYGLSQEQSEAALDLLPKEVSFLLSPYSILPQEWVKMARDKGHEVWLNLPIQNDKTTDLGKNTIFHHASINKKIEAMKRSMALAEGYVGLASYTDESINIASKDYLKLADEIYSRGLGFFEINPNAPNLIKGKAFSKSAPYIKADLEIFKINGEHNSFETLEKIAHKKGSAIAVIPSYPNTIKNLAMWIMKIAQSDYIIAPISAIYDLPLYRDSNNND